MEWRKNGREWAISQCAEDYKFADPWAPDEWVEHWLSLNSHKYRENGDLSPVTKEQARQFVFEVMRLIEPPEMPAEIEVCL